MKGLKVDIVPCLSDNYAYLIEDVKSGVTAIVDPSEADPVIQKLNQLDKKLDYILNTHHHFDHTGGNKNLKIRYSSKVIGPKADEGRIPDIDIALGEGMVWDFGSQKVQILDIPGHTRGHIAFYFFDNESIFTGDTLFSVGCGRLFEGTPKQMYSSLNKLYKLPSNTKIYCGHEYTEKNIEFALTLEPENQALLDRQKEVLVMREKGLPSIPSTLENEKKTNPFLRTESKVLRKNLGMDSSDSVEVFAKIRELKDSF